MPLLDKILLSIVLGAFIGLEREYHKGRPGSGVRTAAFICLFGMLSTFFALTYGSPLILAMGIGIASALAVSLFWYKTRTQTHTGLTTSITIILTYFIGSMVALEFYREAIATSVIIFLLLFSKNRLVGNIRHLSEKEILNAVEFAILAFVIYPFLPDYVLLGVNIREAWGVVLAVSVVSFIGFLATRHFDEQKGVMLSSFFGSIFSSSAVVISNIQNYRKNKKLLNLLAFSSLLAFVVMAVRNMIAASFFTEQPGTIMLFASLISVSVIYLLFAFYFLRKFPKKSFTRDFESPFAIKPALYFGLIFFLTLAFSRMAVSFAPAAVIPISVLGGLGSGYAVAASLALLFSQGAISSSVFVVSIVLASIAGMLGDIATIYFFRQSKLAKKVLAFTAGFALLLIVVMLI